MRVNSLVFFEPSGEVRQLYLRCCRMTDYAERGTDCSHVVLMLHSESGMSIPRRPRVSLVHGIKDIPLVVAHRSYSLCPTYVSKPLIDVNPVHCVKFARA
jgi:hypothetical protein